MVDEKQIHQIIAELCAGLSTIFPQDKVEAILFGSCARGEQEEGSDIDVLLLVDAPREMISQYNWRIGNMAAELLLDHGVLVSPVVENRSYYIANADKLPLFRNIQREGVRISA